ncbi:MAG: polyhydroxyalkanoate depolymerase [Hyphomicrobiales bacterium]|nr:polyhydroxyalkanoate depolymerase [Hyphomicrobiales bacterium]
MNYHTYELAHIAAAPMRWSANALKMQIQSPLNPYRDQLMPRMIAAGCELFENVTRRYGKPEFGIESTKIFGMNVPVHQKTILSKPFCDLVYFERDEEVTGSRDDPHVLIVAPMSGHYATLLRGTVASMLPEHHVYITDWADARNVSMSEGRFDLDDFIDYIIEFIQFIGPRTHVVAVCQPAVPVLAAVSVMASREMEQQPQSMTLMGGPIDTRRNETVVNKLAKERPLSWFENNVIYRVPFPNPGFMRRVYPGFIQLTGFMQMNLERHVTAHQNLFENLVKGDCDSVEQHQKFYDEYLAVMDLPAEFYLQTVETVFQTHDLPDGELMHRGELVDPAAITRTALMTVEGENDDICGLGQTEAAQDLCKNIPIDEKYHYVQPGVGHYGVFNGTRWRTEIQPRIREFIRTIKFKRMTGNGSTIGLPYRKLTADREEIVEYSPAD